MTMYLKRRLSSPAGNRALHFEHATLPWYQLPGESIVTILYFAPQLGQLNRIGSELFMSEIKRNKCQRDSGKSKRSFAVLTDD